MNCRTVRKRFDELYRQSGDDPENPAWRHLVSCADCTREFKQWKKIALTLEHAGPVDLPEAFAQKVMIAYKERQQRAPWFNPMPIRLPHLAWAMLFLVILGGAVFWVQRSVRESQEPRIASAATENVRFELAAEGASSVTLVGDFNGWDRKACLMTREKTGLWSVEMQIAPGSYQYLFLVDDRTWRSDPLNARSSPDGFGGMNSEITL
jgi:hypothetical protein